ncbi:MAG: UDP-N-acetylmuramoylalanyl-D-glutamate--2,6-diaminopimelate ligase, partial [Candidatus Berkelbacteria bacterium Licking1014_2]
MVNIKSTLKNKLPNRWLLAYHWLNGWLAAAYWGFPGRQLKVICVTGTNGKTTTCQLIDSILREAGRKTCLASTIELRINKKSRVNKTKMTTMPAWQLQKFLAEAVKDGCQWAVIETTSHAIVQNRLLGIKPYISVFTNLTHDHLDYHQNIQSYKEAKLKIFQRHPFGIVANLDDKVGLEFLSQTAEQKLSYGLEKKTNLTAKKIVFEPDKTFFSLVTPRGQIAVNFRLPAKFNLENCLAASAACLLAGIDLETIKTGLEKVGQVPGRMELVRGKNRRVMIDYAHSPDALEKIYG